VKNIIIFIAIFITVYYSSDSLAEGDNLDRKGIGLSSNITAQTWGIVLSMIETDETSGVFFDFKMSFPLISASDNFYDNISLNKAENILNDRLIDVKDSWISINVGAMVEIYKYLSLYFGLGASFYSEYRKYYDRFEILGRYGKYWIENNQKDTTYFDMLYGVIITPVSWLPISVGYEKNPKGLNLSISFLY